MVKSREELSRYSLEYYHSNKSSIRERHLIRKSKNPLKYILAGARKRAQYKGQEFDITIDDLVLPTHCPVFGTEMRVNAGKPGRDSFSIDRIDSSKGYIKGNVRIISKRANDLKSDMSIEECECILNDLKNIKTAE